MSTTKIRKSETGTKSVSAGNAVLRQGYEVEGALDQTRTPVFRHLLGGSEAPERSHRKHARGYGRLHIHAAVSKIQEVGRRKARPVRYLQGAGGVGFWRSAGSLADDEVEFSIGQQGLHRLRGERVRFVG